MRLCYGSVTINALLIWFGLIGCCSVVVSGVFVLLVFWWSCLVGCWFLLLVVTLTRVLVWI